MGEMRNHNAGSDGRATSARLYEDHALYDLAARCPTHVNLLTEHFPHSDEHYYQNVKTGSHSPRAREYVRQHKREISECSQPYACLLFWPEANTWTIDAESEREQAASAVLSSSGTPEIPQAPRVPQASYSEEVSPLAAHGMAPPRGVKRHVDPMGEQVAAKRQHLPSAEPHIHVPLASGSQVGLASEQWLAQPPHRPRTRLPAGPVEARGTTMTETIRPANDRAQLPMPLSRRNNTAFDALLWASEVHSNESSLTSAESRSQSRSESVSRATSLHDESRSEQSVTGTAGKAHPPQK